MSDTAATVQRSIKIGRWEIDERHLLRLVTWGILLALAVAVVLLRLQRLDELPPGLMGDEDRNGLAALHVLQGEHAVFFPQFGVGREASTVYVLALSTLLFGRTLFAIHLPTALGSAGMVFGVFWMGRLLFGRSEEGGQATPWRGLLIGSVAAGLMAVSLGQTILGRTGYNRTTHMPLILTLCLGLLWWGWKERNWRWVVLAGLCAGILPYTYYPARLAPILFLAFGLSFLFPLRAGAWDRVRAEIPWAAAFLGAAALVAAPLLIHFAVHPEHFFMRTEHLLVFAPEVSQGQPLRTFLLNVWDHIKVLGFDGDPNWQNNNAGRPMLNPWEAFFFWLGAGMALWQWRRRPDYRLLILWTCVMLLPAVLARDEKASNTLRMIAAAPAIYLLLGVGVWEVFRFLQERFFGEHGTTVGIVAGSVIGFVLLMQGMITHRTYFTKWAVAPEVHALYKATVMEMMEAQEAQISMPGAVYLLPQLNNGKHEIGYLYDRFPFHFLFAVKPELPQMVESVLAGSDEFSVVKVIEWGHLEVLKKGRFVAWQRDEARNFIFLLSKYGRYQGSEAYGGHRVHSFTDISLEGSWRFYDEMEEMTVDYDGGIALQGIALGQGPEQMSTAQMIELGRERPIWMALQWQIEPGLAIDYAISLRLHDAGGDRVFQKDLVLWDAGHRPTSNWPADGPVDSLGLIQLSADLPAGEYELRMVVYDFETLVPTVEVGVWKPEVTLGRVRLADVQ